MKTIVRALLLTMVAVTPMFAQGNGHHSCCPQCGCHQVRKVCRLVPDVKKVTKTVYDYECEDFCVPGPSKICGIKCVPDCDAHHGVRKEIIWQPCCGKVYTRKKLVKKTITEEKPGFKCVVVCLCNSCGSNCGEEDCGEQPGPETQAMLDNVEQR